MKKIMAFIAATFMSLGLFASSVTLATNSNIQGGFQNQGSVGGIGVAGSAAGAGTQGTDGEAGFFNLVSTAINWVLSLLGLITLVFLLYGGFNMVTAAGDDEKYQSGFKILKQAGVGLLFIGISWILVRFIFAVIGSFTG